MTKRVVVSALCCALWVLTTGCGDECVDAFDCRNDNGQPPAGQEWSCSEDNKCVQRPVTEPPPEEDAGTDAGTGTDAGVDAGMDAGTDAGTDMDAGTDAGTDMDAGTDAGSMSVAKGEACTSSGDCMAGLRCEAAAGSTDTTCQAMHIAVTANRESDDVIKALVMRFDATDVAPAELTPEDTSSRYPRWGPGGTRIAFARGAVESSNNAENEAGELVVRDIPLGEAAPTVLANGTSGNTRSFRYMEWEPGNSILYVRRTAEGATTGLTLVPTNGGAITEPTTSGTFPDWRDATTFAYSAATVGISTSTVGGTPMVLQSAGDTAEQPHYNRANNQLLYLANPDNQSATFSSGTTPLTMLYTIPVTGGGQPLQIAARTSVAATGDPAGTVESYIANPNWAPDGSWVAYVRAYFFRPTDGGNATLCNGANCGGQAGNDIVLRRIRINQETGALEDAEVTFVPGGTLPSFSPDGRHLAYIQGGELYIQELNPTTGAKVGTALNHDTGTTYRIQTGAGDDHRPRWQPK